MEPTSEMNWFAIHTKRHRETLAAAGVGALGLAVFLPMVKVECLEHFAIKKDSQPLFPGYFFARFCPAISLSAVESARGVLRIIKSGAWPIPVDEQAIVEIQGRVAEDGLIPLENRELKPGDQVSIQQGPFAGMLARVEMELDGGRRVAILLQAMWNARVLIEKRWVEAEAA